MTPDGTDLFPFTPPQGNLEAERAEGRRPVHVVRFELGGVIFGVEALAVESIEDADAPEKRDVTLDMDLAMLLGLDAPPEESMRRAVVVKAQQGLLRLKVGELTRVVSLDHEAVHEVPPFIGGLTTTAGIRSVFQGSDGLGFVLDVEALGSVGAR